MQEAALAAHRQYRFLLVYLHSPEHEDTARFCAETLCDGALTEHVDRNYVAWGGDIRRTDAFRVGAPFSIQSFRLCPQTQSHLGSLHDLQRNTVWQGSSDVDFVGTPARSHHRIRLCKTPNDLLTMAVLVEQLAASLRASAYPYVALLAFSGARTRLIVSVQVINRSNAAVTAFAVSAAPACREDPSSCCTCSLRARGSGDYPASELTL